MAQHSIYGSISKSCLGCHCHQHTGRNTLHQISLGCWNAGAAAAEITTDRKTSKYTFCQYTFLCLGLLNSGSRQQRWPLIDQPPRLSACPDVRPQMTERQLFSFSACSRLFSASMQLIFVSPFPLTNLSAKISHSRTKLHQLLQTQWFICTLGK